MICQSSARLLAAPAAAPVLLWYVHRQHLQGLHALDDPAVPLADPGCLHLQESVGHAAPEHGVDGLHVESGGTLGHRVLVFTFEDCRRQGHGVLDTREIRA